MNTSDILAIVGIALSIVGIPLAVILARRGRKRPYIRHLVDFEVIASSKHGGFHSGFLRTSSGETVTRIARTSVAIWNHQGDTIRGTDIVPDDRLRIQLKEGDHALQARVVGRSRQQNKLSAAVDPDNDSAVCIDFDFLDADDGGVIEIIHQGANAPELLGTIRGADVGGRRKADLRPDFLEMATKSWLKRFKLLPLRLRIVTIGGLALYALLTAGFASYQLMRTPTLVDIATYDLESLAGQQDFSRKVTAVGLPSTVGLWTAFAGMAFLTLAFNLLLRERMKILFPRSVVRILEPVPKGDEPEDSTQVDVDTLSNHSVRVIHDSHT